MSIQEHFDRFKSGSTRLYIRAAALVGILLAVGGPFFLLTNGGRELSAFPWYIWVILPLLLALVLAAGVVMFRRVSHHAEDISISPDGRDANDRRERNALRWEKYE